MFLAADCEKLLTWETLICIVLLVKAVTKFSKLNLGEEVFFIDWQSQKILLTLEKIARQSDGGSGNSICHADLKIINGLKI